MIGSVLQQLNDRVQNFQEGLQRLFDESLKDDILNPWRQKAWERFLHLGLPTSKEEAFKYVPLRKLYGKDFIFSEGKEIQKSEIQEMILPECQQLHLVFVNGQFSQELSVLEGFSEKVVLLSLSEAMKSYGVFLQHRIGQTLKKEKDPFAVLNMAFQTEGAFVYLPPKVSLKKPLQVLSITTSENIFSSPRLHFVLGKGARARCIATSAGAFSNGVIDLSLEEESHMEFYEKPISLEDGWVLQTLHATLKKKSHLQTTSFLKGKTLFRQNYHIELMEEQAEVNLKGIWNLSQLGQAHTQIFVEHQAPRCRSMQLFKGVLDDHSLSSFEGKIFVHPEAQKTEAYQLNQNLLLNGKASAYSKPNLEIFADDVKASHGATVSQLKREDLFYLKTRGITTFQARSLLLEAFMKEIVHTIPFPSLRELMK